MKAIFSFWRGGWRRGVSQELLDMQKIALYCAKKHFKEVILFTDSASINSFKHLSFNSIEPMLDEISFEYHSVWSINKLFVFKHMCKKGDPFIHIDYDAFLWDNLPERLYKADVFAQCKESDSYIHYEVEKFLKYCPDPGLIGKINPKPRHGINMGIFGGKNLDFINKYTQEALDISLNEKNKEFLYNGNIFTHDWTRTCIIEQYTLPVASQYHNVNVDYLFEWWPNKEQTNAQKYTHLLDSKSNPGIREKVSKIALKIP